MEVINGGKRTAEERVEALLEKAKENVVNDTTEGLIKELQVLLVQRQKAFKVVQNLDREIAERKIKVAQELESLDAAS